MPSVAQEIFGARLDLAVTYADLLATEGVDRGLLGPREAPRLWQRHLLNCAVVAGLVPENADVCDLGSGAGLPGLVLAICRPDLALTLVEPLLRRTSFLTETADRLGLPNVEVVRARAEELHGAREFTVVTSRAVAPLPRLLAWSMPLVRRDGQLLAMKGTSAADELAGASADLSRWGATGADVLEVGRHVITPPTTVIRAAATGEPQIGWTSDRAATIGGGRRSQRRGWRT